MQIFQNFNNKLFTLDWERALKGFGESTSLASFPSRLHSSVEMAKETVRSPDWVNLFQTNESYPSLIGTKLLIRKVEAIPSL